MCVRVVFGGGWAIMPFMAGTEAEAGGEAGFLINMTGAIDQYAQIHTIQNAQCNENHVRK